MLTHRVASGPWVSKAIAPESEPNAGSISVPWRPIQSPYVGREMSELPLGHSLAGSSQSYHSTAVNWHQIFGHLVGRLRANIRAFVEALPNAWTHVSRMMSVHSRRVISRTRFAGPRLRVGALTLTPVTAWGITDPYVARARSSADDSAGPVPSLRSHHDA